MTHTDVVVNVLQPKQIILKLLEFFLVYADLNDITRIIGLSCSKKRLCKPIFVAAAFGGVIGLCIGFSLLSGVELIYWFTLRLFIDQFRKKK